MSKSPGVIAKGSVDPLADLSAQLTTARLFQSAARIDSGRQEFYRRHFESFMHAWNDTLEHIDRVAQQDEFKRGDRDLKAALFFDTQSSGEKFYLLIGYVKAEDEINRQNAGIVLSAPLGRLRDPEMYWDDYKLGLSQGVFVKMHEEQAKRAMKFAMNTERVSDFDEPFPQILTPEKPVHWMKNINAWLVAQLNNNSAERKVALRRDVGGDSGSPLIYD